ncbi:MAG: NAD(P)H-quinone oxidoreductase [Myxococcaceae bacterium]
MKAARITSNTGPAGLVLQEVAEPSPGPDELLVQVRATAVNRADLLQCLGRYPAPPGVPADIPGLEYAGVVLSAGPRATRFKPGDAVMGLVGGGAFAERVVTHEREAVPVPGGLAFDRAAAIPEAFFTAFDALVLQGGLRPSEAVLVHAAASGVGTAATQLASALGAMVLGTGRTEAKLARAAASCGLAHPLVCREDPPKFADRVRSLTKGAGADLVLDLVGGGYFPETLKAMAPGGRVLLVGLLAGLVSEVNLGTLLTRRLTVVGSSLRSRPLEEKIALARAFERQVLPLFAAGRLHPVVDGVLPMSRVREALERLSRNETFGKLVLEWEPS